jgi:hypothetical protein
MTYLPGQTGKVKVLFVSADPTRSLLLDEEIREITDKVRATTHRELLTFQQIGASRPKDLLRALNEYTPHIVHFSGHGSKAGELMFLGEQGQAHPISETALEALFSTLKDNIQVVLLNACYSERQARAITNVINCAIGMRVDIRDKSAIVFSSTFYQAIGFGRSVQDAFDQGKVALQMENMPGHTIPQLLLKEKVNPKRIHLVQNLQERDKQSTYKQRLKSIEQIMTRGHYEEAYQEVMSLLNEADIKISTREQARLKYLEALIHLAGKRPSAQVLSVMRRVEELLYRASSLHDLFAYMKILAILKQDFARTGIRVRKQKEEADKLTRRADLLQMQTEDHEILALFASCLPQVFQDYKQQLHKY